MARKDWLSDWINTSVCNRESAHDFPSTILTTTPHVRAPPSVKGPWSGKKLAPWTQWNLTIFQVSQKNSDFLLNVNIKKYIDIICIPCKWNHVDCKSRKCKYHVTPLKRMEKTDFWYNYDSRSFVGITNLLQFTHFPPTLDLVKFYSSLPFPPS